jgi:ABC-2 type transport system permease protein
MRPTLTLFRREFTSYFLSPIAYLLLVVFTAVMGVLFYATMKKLTEVGPEGIELPMQGMLGNGYFWLGFLVIPALLTMRSFAEERGNGTLEMLLTAPLRDWQVVIAKYGACLMFYVVLWLPTLAYYPVLVNLQGRHAGIDPWPVATSYVGVFLVGAMFLAIGLFVSSLVRSQLVALLVSLAVCLTFVAVAFVRPFLDTSWLLYRLVSLISVPIHFGRDFTRGQIDTRQLVLYSTVAVFFLFMTVRSLESRRWR